MVNILDRTSWATSKDNAAQSSKRWKRSDCRAFHDHNGSIVSIARSQVCHLTPFSDSYYVIDPPQATVFQVFVRDAC